VAEDLAGHAMMKAASSDCSCYEFREESVVESFRLSSYIIIRSELHTGRCRWWAS
jgi:hypothetical protein